ncbi:hypothetical protein SAMN02910451_01369 [Butyrivibrio hungatei]|uniref:Uncharacterized protein n=1 Tax=Butyrivibrio hungatei TaxID=185008 RepID=A0A1G5D3E0_9FIRM|nr:hypothetical protein [Butyrivibrio hungatei]SCY09156.1 hypothetical protein SAMN02910451_01369 [Butyrivibrio hungatei]
MSKKIEFVAALCMTIGLMSGCTSYSEGSSAAIEGFSDGVSEESSEISSKEASDSASLSASEASSKLSSDEVTSKIGDMSKNVNKDSESASSSSASTESSQSKTASDSASSAKSTDDKPKAKKLSKNGIVIPEIEDGVTKIGDRGVEVTFEWEPDKNVDRYEISVDGKPHGDTSYSHIEDVYSDTPTYTYKDKINYDIRIKVRAHKGDAKKAVSGDFSEYAYGNTCEDALTAPKVKDGVTGKGANGTEVYFVWEPVDGAEHYEVVVEHKKKAESEYDLKEVTYTNAPNYTYTGQGEYDVRITVKAQTNAWINGKKKMFNSAVSAYAKGKTY